VIAVISTIYTLFLIWAAGYTFILLSCILLAPATALYVVARREEKVKIFTTPGLIVFLLVLAFAVIGLVLLAKGVVQI
jgi:arginine:ornithine antiporter/lysine permease